jgi:guanylate kinase
MRQDEQQGREYHFLTDAEFDEKVRNGDFLEHVQYGSYRYGTLRSEVEANMAAGRSVLLEIELEGARAIRRKVPGAVLFFIAPPSPEELRRRLEGRDTETAADIEKRLARAGDELASQGEFDYIVVNDSVEIAADELEQLTIKCLREA